jgi:hypothetical protein
MEIKRMIKALVKDILKIIGFGLILILSLIFLSVGWLATSMNNEVAIASILAGAAGMLISILEIYWTYIDLRIHRI